jgi:diguanylate cyclase (GGDEF)-like protein
VTPLDPRRAGDRRTGAERRASIGRRGASPEDGQPGRVSLERLFPYAQFTDRDALAPVQAIAAHQHDLGTQLGRDPGFLVGALDYLLNITHDLVAPTIVGHEVLEILERRSVTDPLTGLFNRYHFDATLKREVARCRRHAARLSLLLLDVDELKTVNDRWGHHAGDRMLGRVAATIRQRARGSDIACRYGGDEFAVILPDTDARGARVAAERIRLLLPARTRAAVPRALTVSVGIASFPRDATTDRELVAVAEHALDAAVARGGNRTVLASVDTEAPEGWTLAGPP